MKLLKEHLFEIKVVSITFVFILSFFAFQSLWFDVFGWNTELADKVENVRGAVVHIEKVGEWQGSGFIVSEDGLIVTASHVVEGGGEFVITLDNRTKYTTTLCAYDKLHDVGFIKIEPNEPLSVVELSVLDQVRAGETVFIMGSPYGYDNFNSVTLGIVSAGGRNIDMQYGWNILFQSDSAAYPGNSGGPVFNLQGKVIGVLVGGMDASLNYSVPVSVFVNDLDIVKLILSSDRFVIPDPEEYTVLEQATEYLQLQIDELRQEIDNLIKQKENENAS